MHTPAESAKEAPDLQSRYPCCSSAQIRHALQCQVVTNQPEIPMRRGTQRSRRAQRARRKGWAERLAQDAQTDTSASPSLLESRLLTFFALAVAGQSCVCPADKALRSIRYAHVLRQVRMIHNSERMVSHPHEACCRIPDIVAIRA
jgi:hypothetical protein